MKTLMVFAVVGLIAAVSARQLGGQGAQGGQGGQGGQGDQGGQVNPGGPMKPADLAPAPALAPGQEGFDDIYDKIKDNVQEALKGFSEAFGSFGGVFGGDRYGCVCRNQCRRNTGTKNVGCSNNNNRAEYLQCVNTTCSNQTCPEQQLFNQTTRVCESCAPGYHVDASKRSCVCNRGTTFDFKNRTCGPCPTDAVITDDRCYCSNTTVLHRSSYACKACPAGAKKVEKQCVCTDKQQFWNEKNFTCKSCPGSWVNETIIVKKPFGRQREVVIELCQCPGANEVFNKFNVTCVACPANSTFKKKLGVGYCVCATESQVYDFQTNTCVDWY